MAAKLGADDKKFKMADSQRHVIIMYMTLWCNYHEISVYKFALCIDQWAVQLGWYIRRDARATRDYAMYMYMYMNVHVHVYRRRCGSELRWHDENLTLSRCNTMPSDVSGARTAGWCLVSDYMYHHFNKPVLYSLRRLASNTYTRKFTVPHMLGDR